MGVAQVYVQLPEQPGKERVPNSALCGFERVLLKRGQSTDLTFHIQGYVLQVVKESGSRTPAVGLATFYAGGLSPGGTSATSTIISGTVQLIPGSATSELLV